MEKSIIKVDFFQFIKKKVPFDHMSAHNKVPTLDYFHFLTNKKSTLMIKGVYRKVHTLDFHSLIGRKSLNKVELINLHTKKIHFDHNYKGINANLPKSSFSDFFEYSRTFF